MMDRDASFVVLRVERAGAATRVLSPGVGRWSSKPSTGELVGPGSRVGWFEILGRRVELVLPDGSAGAVRALPTSDHSVAVEYGQVLFELVPLAGDETASRSAAGGSASATPDGTWAVTAPTDGTFYRSPIPGAAPFVDVGTRVATGDPVGLVEVMKTFNRVLFGGAGLPEEARIVEVRADDASEVRAGQVLFVVR